MVRIPFLLSRCSSDSSLFSGAVGRDVGEGMSEGWVPAGFQSHIFGTHSEYWRGDGASEVDTEGRGDSTRPGNEGTLDELEEEEL